MFVTSFSSYTTWSLIGSSLAFCDFSLESDFVQNRINLNQIYLIFGSHFPRSGCSQVALCLLLLLLFSFSEVGGFVTRKPSQAVNLSSLFPRSLLQHRLNSIMETGTFCLLSSGHFLLVAMAHVETVDLGVFPPPPSTRTGLLFHQGRHNVLVFYNKLQAGQDKHVQQFFPCSPPPNTKQIPLFLWLLDVFSAYTSGVSSTTQKTQLCVDAYEFEVVRFIICAKFHNWCIINKCNAGQDTRLCINKVWHCTQSYKQSLAFKKQLVSGLKYHFNGTMKLWNPQLA